MAADRRFCLRARAWIVPRDNCGGTRPGHRPGRRRRTRRARAGAAGERGGAARREHALVTAQSGRCARSRYRGSRSFMIASNGLAMKIDEYAPLMRPTKSASP